MVTEPPTTGPLIVLQEADGFPEGIIAGTLVERDGCVYIDDSNAVRGVAVFAAGTTWNPATTSVTGPDGTVVAITHL